MCVLTRYFSYTRPLPIIMNNPESFFGKIKELQIENFGAEVIFQNGNYSLKATKLSEFSTEPEWKKILFKNGNKVLEKNKSSYSDFISEIRYEYDNFGNTILIDHKDYQIFRFEYNGKNQLIRKEKEQGARGSWYNKYFYENGNLIKEEWRSDFKALIDWFYEYDNYNNQTKRTGKYLLGQVETFFEGQYEYNPLNKLVKSIIERYEDNTGVINEIITMDYGQYNELITHKKTETKNRFGEEIIEEFYEYDENGFLKSYLKTNNGNEWDNLKWEYEIDQDLNWTSSTLFDKDKPTLITKRKLIK